MRLTGVACQLSTWTGPSQRLRGRHVGPGAPLDSWLGGLFLLHRRPTEQREGSGAGGRPGATGHLRRCSGHRSDQVEEPHPPGWFFPIEKQQREQGSGSRDGRRRRRRWNRGYGGGQGEAGVGRGSPGLRNSSGGGKEEGWARPRGNLGRWLRRPWWQWWSRRAVRAQWRGWGGS